MVYDGLHIPEQTIHKSAPYDAPAADIQVRHIYIIGALSVRLSVTVRLLVPVKTFFSLHPKNKNPRGLESA